MKIFLFLLSFIALSPLLYSMEIEKRDAEYITLAIICKRNFCRYTQPHSLLQNITLQLPEDVQNKIMVDMFESMFGKGEKAKHVMKEFYKKNPLEAFQPYYDIKNKVRLHDPIIPLYNMSQEKREAVLNELDKPLYRFCCDQFISEKTQWKIQKFDKDQRQYFIGKKVIVVPDDILIEYVKLQLGIVGLALFVNGVFPLLYVPFIGFKLVYSSGILSLATMIVWGTIAFCEIWLVYGPTKELYLGFKKISL